MHGHHKCFMLKDTLKEVDLLVFEVTFLWVKCVEEFSLCIVQ